MTTESQGGGREAKGWRGVLDRLRLDRFDPRLAWVALFGGMAVSAAVCLRAARDTTFTQDEFTWITTLPDQTLEGALSPHSGHLVFIPRLLYKAVFETIGSGYLTFRLITLAAVYLTVVLLFVYLRRRIGAAVALAPCLVLLFFASDTGHLLQGNGFTIMFSLACGIGALLAFERGTSRGDVLAAALLCLGTLTYTVALPFAAGLAALVALRRDRWHRLWVPAAPVLLYLAWRAWVSHKGLSADGSEADPAHLLLLPAWTFQSLSGILSALTGLNYNFSEGGFVGPTALAGPALALVFVAWIGWRVAGGSPGAWFWGTVAIMLALFAIQALVWVPGVRDPGSSRYLYPGAIAVILVAAEAARGLKAGRAAFVAICLVAVAGVGSNVMIAFDRGATLRVHATEHTAEVTVTRLAHQAQPFEPGPAADALDEIFESGGIAYMAWAEVEYGGMGLTDAGIAAQSEEIRAKIDSDLARAHGAALLPVDGSQAECAGPFARPGEREEGSGGVDLPFGGVLLREPTGSSLRLGRFGDGATIDLGQMAAGATYRLDLPEDGNARPWFIQSDGRTPELCATSGHGP